MTEIRANGKTILNIKENNIIQILGNNLELKKKIINIIDQTFEGYKYSYIDIDYMDGFYPEILRKDRTKYKKKDRLFLRLSSIDDVLDEFKLGSGSLLLNYINSITDDIEIALYLDKVEEALLNLSNALDNNLNKKFENENIFLNTVLSNMDMKDITKTFYEVNYSDPNKKLKPLWLFKEEEVISLFISIMISMIEGKEDILLVLDGIDSEMSNRGYDMFISKLLGLLEVYPNLEILSLPKNEFGVIMNKEVFSNTYILNEEVIELREFDMTYDIICDHYPDLIYPTEEQVMYALLILYPNINRDILYSSSVETIILQIFLNLLDEDNVKVENSSLSRLEINFLTSLSK